MQRTSPQHPTFTPGTRLSRLPVRTEPEGLEDFYRDLFASPGPEHDRERLLRLLDEDVADGAAAQGRSGAMDHLGRAFRHIDAWTLQGDYLPEADRAERERQKAEEQAAKAKANAPAYVNDIQWNKNGDQLTVSGKAADGSPVRKTIKGHVLPDKTKGGVRIKAAPNADRRVTKEMSDTLQDVLDDPRCKQAGITDVTISSTTNGLHSGPEDRHYQGKAVDIAEINGKPIGKDEKAKEQTKVLQEVIKDKAKEKDIKDNLGPGKLDFYREGKKFKPKTEPDIHADHVHIAIW